MSENVSSKAHLKVGKSGEEIAQIYLKKQGYKILESNYSCAVGELDLVASEHGVLCFVEVKTRTTAEFGSPQEAVTPTKQRKITQAAQNYLAHKGLYGVPCRFDVVAINLLPTGKPKHIELIKNAFPL